MKMNKAVLVILGSVLLVGIFTTRAQTFNKDTTVTFSQPVQVPGQALPAGTYTFTTFYSSGTRIIVRIWNKDKTKLITQVLGVVNYRLKPAGEVLIKFHEPTAGEPQALKAWFYPGKTYGIEFVYPKQEAVKIAQANNEEVPAETLEATPSTLKTVPLVAVTPQGVEEPLEQAFPAKAPE